MHAQDPRTVRRTVLKAGLAVAAAPAIVTSAGAQAKITWKLQSYYTTGSGSFKANLMVLAREIERRTQGRLRIEPLGAGEIAKGSEIFPVVRRGVVQMGTILPGYNLDESELMGLYGGVPGTLRDPWELVHLNKNLGLEEALNRQLRPKGVIAMGEFAYSNELVLKKPIEPGADLAAVKIRSSGNTVPFLAAIGFAPQQIDGSETYQALATGVVDGAHWGAAIGALSMKLYEVAPVHMKPAFSIGNSVYIINAAAYDALPEDLRQILTALLEERYYRYTVDYKHKEAIALDTAITKLGVRVSHFPDDVLARFSGASKALLEKEAARGPAATEFVGTLRGLMKDLHYT